MLLIGTWVPFHMQCADVVTFVPSIFVGTSIGLEPTSASRSYSAFPIHLTSHNSYLLHLMPSLKGAQSLQNTYTVFTAYAKIDSSQFPTMKLSISIVARAALLVSIASAATVASSEHLPGM